MNPVLEQQDAAISPVPEAAPRGASQLQAARPPLPESEEVTFIDKLLASQRQLTAVEQFSRLHDAQALSTGEKVYRRLLPAQRPGPGEQYAFEVDLDKCSGCKACVSACHSLNGLEEAETWRGVGLLLSKFESRGSKLETPASVPDLRQPFGFQQHVTTACHHCVDPGCLNGCPVLAYDKDPVTGIVRHLDDQCIGCTYCVMKCPYEVPKYSSRLGIVRKCDMCANRLSVGEAPACVQGCPNEAIRITVVKQAEVKSEYRSSIGEVKTKSDFLPDAPRPSITLPTTRYVSQRGLPAQLIAGDSGALRLDHAHWPLAIMLVLTQAAAGMFVTNAMGHLASPAFDGRWLGAVGFAVLSAGLAASVLHLGQPLKAWRAFLGWRKSWLSREIIALNAFAGAASMAVAAEFIAPLQKLLPLAPGAVFAGAAGLAGVFASAMVYVDTQRPFWSPRLSFGNFFGTAVLLGPALGTAVFAVSGAPLPSVRTAAIATIGVQVMLFVWRRLEWWAALRNSESATHFNARVIQELMPWTSSAGAGLFASSIVFGILTSFGPANSTPLWACLAALSALSSEIIARHVFFSASASKRMPGGITA